MMQRRLGMRLPLGETTKQEEEERGIYSKKQNTIQQDKDKTVRWLLKYTMVLLTFFFFSGCSAIRVTEDKVDSLEFTDIISEKDYYDIENISRDSNIDIHEEDDFDLSSLYGTWVVSDVAFRDITAVTKGGFKDKAYWHEGLVGSVIEYKEDYISFNGALHEIEGYRYEKDYFFAIVSRLNVLKSAHYDFMEEFQITNTDERLIVSISLVNKTDIPRIGTDIIVIDENHILYFIAGVFFNVYNIGSEDISEMELPIPPDPASPEYLYGRWSVQSVLSNTKPIIENYDGYILEYRKDFITLGDKTYYNPVYSYDVAVGISVLEQWWFDKVDFDILESHYVYTQYLFIDDNHLEEFGMYLYYADNDKLLILHNDVFYLAIREGGAS